MPARNGAVTLATSQADHDPCGQSHPFALPEDELLQAVVAGSCRALLIVDDDGDVRAWNCAATSILRTLIADHYTAYPTETDILLQAASAWKRALANLYASNKPGP